MTIYTVYAPPRSAARDAAAADQVAFVKEGFSFPALLVPILWLLYHRMWLAFIAYLLVSAGLSYLLDHMLGDGVWAGLALAMFAVLFALEANGLRAWSLRRKGYREIGVVAGHSLDDCERKFFAAWLRPSPPPRAPQPVAGVAAAGRNMPEVIGSFPAPGGG